MILNLELHHARFVADVIGERKSPPLVCQGVANENGEETSKGDEAHQPSFRDGEGLTIRASEGVLAVVPHVGAAVEELEADLASLWVGSH